MCMMLQHPATLPLLERKVAFGVTVSVPWVRLGLSGEETIHSNRKQFGAGPRPAWTARRRPGRLGPDLSPQPSTGVRQPGSHSIGGECPGRRPSIAGTVPRPGEPTEPPRSCCGPRESAGDPQPPSASGLAVSVKRTCRSNDEGCPCLAPSASWIPVQPRRGARAESHVVASGPGCRAWPGLPGGDLAKLAQPRSPVLLPWLSLCRHGVVAVGCS